MHALIDSLSFAALALYYAALAALAFYGAHRLTLLLRWCFTALRRPPAVPGSGQPLPTVTVQLPIYNEFYVAERLIDAVVAFDYPRERLEIQVLDDSTDSTADRVAAAVERHRRAGVDIHHIRRSERSGFKAGALAHGLERARGELIAVFDADFVPRSDFLRRTVAGFDAPDVGMVQARWGHLNRDYSLLTRLQAIFLDGHFVVEQAARSASGCFFNFNGTAGVWRRQAIEDGGGWTQDTLTEDLDLSYRAQLAGWKFRFLPETVAPAELPVDIHGFKRQQYRWAKGSIQTARKHLGRVLTSRLDLSSKLEAFVHLTNNAAYLFMLCLSLLVFPAMVVRHNFDLHSLTRLDVALFSVASLPVILFYVASQLGARPRRADQLVHLFSLMALGIGLSVNNCRAVLSGLVRDGGVFERTPKYRIESRSDGWQRKRYRASGDTTVVIEGLFTAYFVLALVFSWRLEMWESLLFLALFMTGYGYVFALSCARHLRLARRRRRPESTAGLEPQPLP